MTTRTIITTAAVLGILAIAAVALARGGYGQGYGMGWSHMGQGYHHGWNDTLTDEQRAEFETLRTAHWNTVEPLRSQLQSKEAKLNYLLTEPKENAKQIETLIDDIATLEAQLTKEHVKFRSLVAEKFGTDFTRGYGRGMHRGHGMGMGFGQGLCAGYGR